MAISILILGMCRFLLLPANWLNGAIFALFVIFVLAASIEGRPIAWSVLRLHLFGGAGALGAGITLFAAGWIGDGAACISVHRSVSAGAELNDSGC